MRSYMLLAFLMASVVFISACTGGSPESPAATANEQASQQLNPPETESGDSDSSVAAGSSDSSPAQPSSSPLWMTAELTDVATGETFSISDFQDRPVLIESFAVWCPLCTRQQQESKKLEEELGDAVVSVSLNTDPNEDESNVRQHIRRNGFGWYYAVAPTSVTNSLTDDFGLSITNVPLVPMVLVCPGKEPERLRNGVKSADELKRAVEERCAA